MLANLFKKQTQRSSRNGGPGVSEYSTWSVQSSCIQSMFSYLFDESNQQMHSVLDFGGPNQAILDSLDGYNYRYTICNLVEVTSEHLSSSQNDTELIDKLMENVKSRLDHTDHPISAIFVWDLFNYLGRSDIISLMGYISSHCRKGARLHSISWLTDTIPSVPGLYELERNFNIKYSNQSNQHIQPPGYSAPNLISMMPSFESHRLEIFRLGILEVMLRFNSLVASPDPSMIPTTQLMAYRA